MEFVLFLAALLLREASRDGPNRRPPIRRRLSPMAAAHSRQESQGRPSPRQRGSVGDGCAMAAAGAAARTGCVYFLFVTLELKPM